MYNIEKIPWERRNNLFFSSDWHLFHNPTSWPSPIWEMRGYSSAEEAAQDVQDKVNARCDENSILYYLGDFALNATDQQVVNWLSGIRCQNIRKLWGNHASNTYRLYKQEVHKQFNLDDVEIYPVRMSNVVFVGNHVEISVGKQRISMNHFPLRSWNQMGRGSWMVSGHQHLSDNTRRPDYPHGKCLDVGWDWKRDVWSFQEIKDIMDAKQFQRIDHHDASTT